LDDFGKERSACGIQKFVGIEDQNPAAASGLEGCVSSRAKIVAPWEGDDLGPGGGGHLAGWVGGARVGDDDLFGDALNGLEAPLEHGLLVPGDDGEGE
jgi:hypothetical protein